MVLKSVQGDGQKYFMPRCHRDPRLLGDNKASADQVVMRARALWKPDRLVV